MGENIAGVWESVCGLQLKDNKIIVDNECSDRNTNRNGSEVDLTKAGLRCQMVILEGAAMLQVGNNQYLQPDYLSPLPTTVGFFLCSFCPLNYYFDIIWNKN